MTGRQFPPYTHSEKGVSVPTHSPYSEAKINNRYSYDFGHQLFVLEYYDISKRFRTESITKLATTINTS
jgi:hypothetical protein